MPLVPAHSYAVFDGDSLMADASEGHSPAYWASFALRGRLRTANTAIGGTRVTDLSAIGIGGSTRISAILAYSPKIVFDVSGHNDLAAGVLASALIPAQQARINALFAGGVERFVTALVPPVDRVRAGATWSNGTEAERQSYIAVMTAWAQTEPRVAIVDPAAIGLDPAGYFDETHYKQIGAAQVGQALASAADALIEPADVCALYNGAENLLGSGALMLGTSGSKSVNSWDPTPAPPPSGPVPDGWSLAHYLSGVSMTTSQSSMGGASALRMVMSGTPVSGGLYSTLVSPWATFSGAAGDVIEGWVDVAIGAGCSGVGTIGLSVEVSGESGVVARSSSTGPSYPMPSDAASGVVRTRYRAALTGARTQVRVLVGITGLSPTYPLSADITVGRPVSRKVLVAPSSAISGAAAASASAQADLSASAPLSGVASCVATATATVLASASVSLSGALTSTSSASAAIGATAMLVGSAVAQATASATVSTSANPAVSGSASASASASAILTARAAVVGSGLATATASVAIAASAQMAASATSSASASATLSTGSNPAISASVSCSSSASATLTATAAITAAAVSTVSSSAAVAAAGALSGTAGASASASAALVVSSQIAAIVGIAAARASASAVLQATAEIYGSCSAHALATATMYLPPSPPDMAEAGSSPVVAKARRPDRFLITRPDADYWPSAH